MTEPVTDLSSVAAGAAQPDRRAGPAHVAGVLIAGLAGAGLAYAVHDGARATLIAIAATQAVLVLSWVFGTGVPGRFGALVTGGLAAAAADTVVMRWPHDELGTLVAVLGLAVPAMFAHQLMRGKRRVRVVESLSDIALLVVATTALAALIQLRHEADGVDLGITVVLCASAALAAGHLVDAVWSPIRFDPAVSRGAPALFVSIIAGAAVAYVRLHGHVELGPQRAVELGAAVAAVTALFAVGVGFIETTSTLPSARPARWLRPVFGTVLSLALMAPVAYLLCLVIRK